MNTETKDTEKISVLMSVYKNDDPMYFRLAMESIINQTYKADEIVLTVDGPIPEKLQEEIDKLQLECDYLNVYPLKENVGLGNALNYGLQKCKNNLVARMDSDDISVLDRFEKQIAQFKKDPSLSIVGGYIDEFNNDPNNPVSVREVPLSEEEIFKKGVVRCPFNHVTVMFKKEDILEIGGYIPVYSFEDYYLWIRLIERKLHCKNMPEQFVHVRIGNGMLNRRCGKKYFESNKFLQDYMLQHNMISRWKYCFNVAARWTVQVVMTPKMREVFYSKVLRRKKS